MADAGVSFRARFLLLMIIIIIIIILIIIRSYTDSNTDSNTESDTDSNTDSKTDNNINDNEDIYEVALLCLCGVVNGLRPISELRFWISEGLTRAES